MINITPAPLSLVSLARKALWGKWPNRVINIITAPSRNEICFYLQQAIETCYNSHGSELPKILNDWSKMGIKIDFSVIPQDIQDGITGIIMCSPFWKTIITKIVTNIPETSSKW
jgi:hypothetical protein